MSTQRPSTSCLWQWGTCRARAPLTHRGACRAQPGPQAGASDSYLCKGLFLKEIISLPVWLKPAAISGLTYLIRDFTLALSRRFPELKPRWLKPCSFPPLSAAGPRCGQLPACALPGLRRAGPEGHRAFDRRIRISFWTKLSQINPRKSWWPKTTQKQFLNKRDS